MALIEVAGVHVRFGDRVVLESIDLAVPEGEFHGLMGPNGAGKTTFFNVLTGRVKPSRGSIRLDGEDVTGFSSHRIAAKGIARSFQIMTLFDDFTARENVMVGLPGFRARGFDMRHAAASDRGFAEKANEILVTVGLADKSGVRAKDLSYGDRRALEIAVALGQSPRVLCLDEPTSGLGTDGVQRLAAMVGRLKGKLTIVAIEHDMEFLFSLADRISVIHWGQVVARGAPHELQQNEWVKRSNLGRFGMILEVEAVDTFYGETQALFGASLAVQRGKVFALLGPNGAGKTTMLRSILGLTRPRRGAIRFDGREVTHSPTHEIARSGIGWVPDDRRLCPTLSVARNLGIAQKRTRFRSWTIKETCEIFSPLEYLMERDCENLSGGEMQMVAIARALVGAPGLILFDEPSQGLAPKIVGDVLATIRRLRDEGVASLVVEQNAEIALSVADQAAVIDRGRIAWAGDAAMLREDGALRQRLLGVQ